MKKFDLQLFASAVPGKRIVYLFRRLSKQAEEGAWNLAFVTENGRTLSVDADSTATKDGSIRTPGVPEQEVTVTCVLSKGDTRVDETEDAILDGEKFEIWEANLEEACHRQRQRKQVQGYLLSGLRHRVREELQRRGHDRDQPDLWPGGQGCPGQRDSDRKSAAAGGLRLHRHAQSNQLNSTNRPSRAAQVGRLAF